MCYLLLKTLRERQMSLSGNSQRLSTTLPLASIPLAEILDREQQLVTHGHVLLGFTRQGHYLISYQSQLLSSVGMLSYQYTLHWWAFDPPNPLVCTHTQQLFAGHSIKQELHLLVCESVEEERVTVVGHQLGGDKNDHQLCYVTIIMVPSVLPARTCDIVSVHTSYDLVPPFPSFVPSLSLKLPDCLLVNTGCSLVAVLVDMGEKRQCPYSPLKAGQCTSFLVQRFATGVVEEQADESVLSSPSHTLPVEVYSGEHALTEVNRGNDEQAGGGQVMVTVIQHCLDLEQWLCQTLPQHLAQNRLQFHGLADYDLQLVDVCQIARDIVFVVVVIVEAFSSDEVGTTSCSNSFSLEVLGSWNFYTGKTEVILFRNLHPFSLAFSCSSQRKWNPARAIATDLRQKFHLPKSATHAVRSLSNLTVFSGKSLRSLRHPVLPVALIRESLPFS